jgi:Family of unknown function (DUF6499)
MPDHNWRDESAYEFSFDLSLSDFAFEFLRRHPDYYNEYRIAAATDTSGAGSEALPMGPDLRWGLSFLDRSRHSRGRPTRILVAARIRLNRHSGTCSRYPTSIRGRPTDG